MKALAGVAAAVAAVGLLAMAPPRRGGTEAAAASAGGGPAAVNPYNGMQEREEVYEFTEKPSVKKEGDQYVISFASKGACDATVAIVGPDGKVVRHLASGVLGKNAPHPFRQGSLSQSIAWDGLDDDGKKAPAGCKVRVSLGLDARFERLETWKLLAGIRPLAVDKDGQVYAVSQAHVTGGVHVFGRDGRYVRTILPPPAFETAAREPAPERFAPIAWNRTARGEWVPRRHRFGGGYDFELTKYPGFFGSLASGAITPDGKLCLLCAPRRSSAKLFLIDTRDGSCPAGGVVDLGKLVTDGMAPSPDGKWLYFAGRPPHPWEKRNPFSHAVMRMSLEKPGKPEVFVGEVAKAGNDNAHFNGPNRVACDKDGNVYVGDRGNGRIQVFKPDGTHVKTVPGATGLFGVSHRTGAIYLWNQVSWTKNPIVSKLGGLENPAKAAETTLSCGGQWREGRQSAILSSQSDPPLIWFAGSSYTGKPVVTGIEDRGNSLASAVDLLKVNETPDAGGDVTGPGMWTSLHVNRRTGEVAWNPVGPDGLEYSRGMYYAENKQCVFRFKPGSDPKKREYVSFANGEAAFALAPTGAHQPLTQGGRPVIGPRMYHAQGSHLHQGPFCVAPNGDIYVGVTYSKETDAELQKAGLPRHRQGKTSVCAPALRVYAPDGKLKTPCALPGLMELEGLRVGRSGAVYVVQPWKPMGQKLPDGLAAGSSYDDSRWGSLIKFAGNFEKFPVGRIEGAWEGAPADPTHQGAGMKVRLEGALWTYGGVSPHSAKYSSCTCMKASADLDDYERSFVCAAQTCTVNVIDSNGNVMARLGGYGNVDSRGGKSPVKDPKTGELRPRRPDDPKDLASPLRPLGFSLPRNAAASDDAVWVVDIDHRALVRAALVYRAEKELALP